MNNEQDILARAKQLIEQGNQDEARLLLTRIPHNHTAQEWLQWLNQGGSAAPTSPGTPTAAAPASPPTPDTTGGQRQLLLILGGLAVLALVAIGLALALVLSGGEDDDDTASDTVTLGRTYYEPGVPLAFDYPSDWTMLNVPDRSREARYQFHFRKGQDLAVVVMSGEVSTIAGELLDVNEDRHVPEAVLREMALDEDFDVRLLGDIQTHVGPMYRGAYFYEDVSHYEAWLDDFWDDGDMTALQACLNVYAYGDYDPLQIRDSEIREELADNHPALFLMACGPSYEAVQAEEAEILAMLDSIRYDDSHWER